MVSLVQAELVQRGAGTGDEPVAAQTREKSLMSVSVENPVQIRKTTLTECMTAAAAAPSAQTVQIRTHGGAMCPRGQAELIDAPALTVAFAEAFLPDGAVLDAVVGGPVEIGTGNVRPKRTTRARPGEFHHLPEAVGEEVLRHLVSQSVTFQKDVTS